MLTRGPKRFYKIVDVKPDGASSAVLLDGKPVKTPAGRAFVASTRALADVIAEEWREQGERIVPDSMPLTKALNTMIDRIAPHRDAIVDDLAKYAGSDLLCYRAGEPAELVRRQSAAWDPWLAWARDHHRAQLCVTTGMAPIQQPAMALERLRAAIASHDDDHLTALHPAVTITGSAVLGLAFVARALDAEEAFAAAQIDEDYQAERWGRDAEADAVRARRLAELRAARRFIDLLD